MVLDSLRGRGAGSVETFHPRELNGATPSRAFALSLRLSTATRSALVLPVQAGKIRGSWASRPTKFYRHTLRRGGVLPRPPLPSHPHFCRGGRPLSARSTVPLAKPPVIAKPVRTPAVAIRIPVQLKNKHLTNPKNNPKMSVSFSSSRKRQRWGKGGDSPTQRESAAGASRWGSLAVLASELPA